MTTSSIDATGHQYLSHANLIKIVESSARLHPKLDAIIVPAGRPAHHLLTAIDLAKEADCHLVVLCSLRTRADRVRALFSARDLTKGTAVTVRPSYTLPGLNLETAQWISRSPGKNVCHDRRSDLSTKRNIGLLIARMLRWRYVLFLDDDIRGISHQDLACTVSLLGAERPGYKSAGMRVKYFPDNSVVCHARRMIGDPQDVFVSGAVLAVDCDQDFAFFPDIYNEDWLFLHDDVAMRRTASPDLHATKMEHMTYCPFADPYRAAREEFGDVIAEGLYSLLHAPSSEAGNAFSSAGYWSQFLDSRKTILKEINDRTESAPVEIRAALTNSIAAAQQTLETITLDMCVSYIQKWQKDLATWAQKRDNISCADNPADALRQLGLPPS